MDIGDPMLPSVHVDPTPDVTINQQQQLVELEELAELEELQLQEEQEEELELEARAREELAFGIEAALSEGEEAGQELADEDYLEEDPEADREEEEEERHSHGLLGRNYPADVLTFFLFLFLFLIKSCRTR